MLYVSIDIETSGLDPAFCKVLSIGAIIEDTERKLPFEECPKFNAIVLQREIYGSPRAITMNKDIISMIGDYLEGDEETQHNLDTHSGYVFLEKDDVVKELYYWLNNNGYYQGIFNSGGYGQFKEGKLTPLINGSTTPITINVAGKNFATFDKLFLEQLPWWKKLIKPRQRMLDPAILMVDWKNDTSLPNLKQCKERSGIEGIVTHNALEDAWDVIEILRKFY